MENEQRHHVYGLTCIMYCRGLVAERLSVRHLIVQHTLSQRMNMFLTGFYACVRMYSPAQLRTACNDWKRVDAVRGEHSLWGRVCRSPICFQKGLQEPGPQRATIYTTSHLAL